MNYFDHVVRAGRLETASHKTDATQILVTVRNSFELKSLQGLCNIFRRLVQNCANLVLLNNKLQKDDLPDFLLEKEEVDSVKRRLQKLFFTPVLKVSYAKCRVALDRAEWDV